MIAGMAQGGDDVMVCHGGTGRPEQCFSAQETFVEEMQQFTVVLAAICTNECLQGGLTRVPRRWLGGQKSRDGSNVLGSRPLPDLVVAL